MVTHDLVYVITLFSLTQFETLFIVLHFAKCKWYFE